MSRHRKRNGRKSGKRPRNHAVGAAPPSGAVSADTEHESGDTLVLAAPETETETEPPRPVAREYRPPPTKPKRAPKLAPKIKTAARRAARRKSGRHPDESSPAGSLPIIAGILLIAVGSALALFVQRDPTDPHFIQAKAVLERYELGKPEESRDYGNPAYTEALLELGRVDRASRWAPRADELAADIRSRTAEQDARTRARAVEIQSRQQLQQQRDEEFFRERRMHPPPQPQPNGPDPERVEDSPHVD